MRIFIVKSKYSSQSYWKLQPVVCQHPPTESFGQSASLQECPCHMNVHSALPANNSVTGREIIHKQTSTHYNLRCCSIDAIDEPVNIHI